MRIDAKTILKRNARIWQLFQIHAKGTPDKSNELVVQAVRVASPRRGENPEITREEGYPLPSRRYARLRSAWNKVTRKGGCQQARVPSTEKEEKTDARGPEMPLVLRERTSQRACQQEG